jgi:hypothetical protein
MATYQVTYVVGASLDVTVEAESKDEAEKKAYPLAEAALGGVVTGGSEGFWLGDLEDVVYVDTVDA